MSRRSIEAGKAVIVVDLMDRTTKAMNNIQSKMMNASRAFRDMSTNFAGGALLSGLAVKGVIGQYTKFEDQLLNLSAKLGIFGNVTAQQQTQLDGLTDTIIKLGKATSYTNSEVADAAISLAQAGFSVDEIKASLKATLDLARGTGYGLGDAADLLANIVRNQDIVKATNSLVENQKAIEHTASMMVKATRLGTIEVWDLRESLKYAAGTTKNLGSDLATVLGLLVQMSETGLKASLAGTSMNVAYQNMVKNLEKAKETLPEFELYVSLDDRIDFTKTFKSLHRELAKLDAVSRTQLLGDIFNIRGARMVASIEDMEKVEKFIYEIGTAGEEAAMAAAKMESGIGGATRRLYAEFEGLNFVIGTAFNKEIKGLLNLTTASVNAFGKFIEKNKLLTASFLAMPFVLAGLAVGSLAFSMVLSRMTWIITGLTKAIGGLKKTAGAMISSVPATIAGAKNWLLTPSPEKAAIQKQSQKVAKLQSKIDAQTARANAKKTAKAQAAALARIQSGATIKALTAESAKLATLMQGRPKAFAGFGGWIKDTYIKAQAARQGQIKLKAQIAAERANHIKLMKEQDRLLSTPLKYKVTPAPPKTDKTALQVQRRLLLNSPIALGDVSAQTKAIANSRQEIANQKSLLAMLAQSRPLVADVSKYEAKILKYNRASAKFATIRQTIVKRIIDSHVELKSIKDDELKVDKAYDRLYKIRQAKAKTAATIQVASTTQAYKGLKTVSNPIYERLAAEEAKLSSFINKLYGVLAVKRKHYEKEISDYSRRLAEVDARKRGVDLRATAMAAQKSSAQQIANATHQAAVIQAKKTAHARIKIEEGVIAKNSRDMSAIQKRTGVAGDKARTSALSTNTQKLIALYRQDVNGASAAKAATDAAKTMASSSRTRALATSSALLSNSRSLLGTLASGLKSFAGLKSIISSINFMKIIQSIVTLTLNFARFTAMVARTTFTLTRFVFSMNFVGIALNILLLFGDKIPVVRKAFEELGAGIGGAFAQLGKIGTYASPALKLITLAMSAFTEGNTAVGLQALQSAFSGIAGVIGNQLSAAWSTFLSKIQETWTFIKQLGSMLMAIINSIGSATSSIIGSVVGVGSRAAGLFGGGGDGFGKAIMNTMATIAMTIDLFITNLAGFIKDLTFWSDIFVNKLAAVFYDVVSMIPLIGGDNRNYAKASSAAAYARISELEGEQKKDRADRNEGIQTRQDAIQKAFFDAMNRNNIAAQHAKDAQTANTMSSIIAQNMGQTFMTLEQELAADVAKRFREQAALEASTSPYSTPETIPYQRPSGLNDVAEATRQFILSAKTVSGNFRSVHANRFMVDSPKELDIQKNMLNELKGIRSDIKTQGAF